QEEHQAQRILNVLFPNTSRRSWLSTKISELTQEFSKFQLSCTTVFARNNAHGTARAVLLGSKGIENPNNPKNDTETYWIKLSDEIVNLVSAPYILLGNSEGSILKKKKWVKKVA
ncbi:27790_t:CDS:2, partial [Dentiscutata erythropus]